MMNNGYKNKAMNTGMADDFICRECPKWIRGIGCNVRKSYKTCMKEQEKNANRKK